MCQLRRIQKEKLNQTMFRSEKSDLYSVSLKRLKKWIIRLYGKNSWIERIV